MFIHLKGIINNFVKWHFHMMENTWRVDFLISNYFNFSNLTEYKKGIINKVLLKSIHLITLSSVLLRYFILLDIIF